MRIVNLLGLLALVFACACSRTSAAGTEARTRFSVSFEAEPAPNAKTLDECVAVYKARMGKVASKVEFAVQADARTLTAELALADLVEAYPPLDTTAKPESAAEEAMRALLELRGELAFLAGVTDEELAAQNTSRMVERERLGAWHGFHLEARLSEFDSVPRAKGGPVAGMRWRQHRLARGETKDTPDREPRLLELSVDARSRFTQADVSSWSMSQDAYGYPALNFELAKNRKDDFSNWTAKLIDRPLAIVIDEEIVTFATVKSRLPGSGVIMGGARGFSEAEVRTLLGVLRAPVLPLRPKAVTSALVR